VLLVLLRIYIPDDEPMLGDVEVTEEEAPVTPTQPDVLLQLRPLGLQSAVQLPPVYRRIFLSLSRSLSCTLSSLSLSLSLLLVLAVSHTRAHALA
jgi:hypothetical protein